MISRDAPRRVTLALTPIFKRDELPAWAPPAPKGGWTPAAAWNAALDYAEEHDGIYDERVLTSAAQTEAPATMTPWVV